MAATWPLFFRALFMVPLNLYALTKYTYWSIRIFAHPLEELLSPYSLVPLLIIIFFGIPMLFCIILLSPLIAVLCKIRNSEPSLRFEDYVDMDSVDDDDD